MPDTDTDTGPHLVIWRLYGGQPAWTGDHPWHSDVIYHAPTPRLALFTALERHSIDEAELYEAMAWPIADLTAQADTDEPSLVLARPLVHARLHDPDPTPEPDHAAEVRRALHSAAADRGPGEPADEPQPWDDRQRQAWQDYTDHTADATDALQNGNTAAAAVWAQLAEAAASALRQTVYGAMGEHQRRQGS